MQSLERRVAALEMPQGTMKPWLAVSRTGIDNEAQAVGFAGFPPREPGEPWAAYVLRAQRWAQAQTPAPFVARTIYR